VCVLFVCNIKLGGFRNVYNNNTNILNTT
jgi:hypothetical protein